MKSAIIVSAIIQKGNKYLLGQKLKDTGPYPNCWLIIGGRAYVEKERLEESLRREIKEEANIEVKDIKQVYFDEDYRNRKGEMTHLIFLTYLVQYKSGVEKPGDDIVQLQWFSKKDLKVIKIAPPSTKLYKHLGWI